MENDIEAMDGSVFPFSNDLGPIEEIGGDKKFVEFTPYIKSSEDVQFKENSFCFKTNSLTIEKLSYNEKRKSILRMILALDKHIKHEISNELSEFEIKLTEKCRKKYNYEKLKSELFKRDS